jgi:hypothetical protein
MGIGTVQPEVCSGCSDCQIVQNIKSKLFKFAWYVPPAAFCEAGIRFVHII